MTSWREYQERVADLFVDLGCSVKVEASVEGVRATHDIDVWVTFERFGLEHRWAVECKYWQQPIPKEKVLALKSIVEDVGADRGILVAESGFQPGAFSAATSSNIVLATLADLRALAESDLQAIILEDLERRVIELRDSHLNLCTYEDLSPGGAAVAPRPGLDFENYVKTSARLGALDFGFDRINVDKFPAPYDIDLDLDGYKVAKGKNQFIELSGRTIEQVDAWISEQEAAIEAVLQEGSDRA